MNTYIALLRGINISGQKIIKMADLRAFLTEAGLSQVQTYIQSGNIIFESSQSRKELTKLIIETIEKHYGFHVPTIILTPAELQQAADNNPYQGTEGNKLYLTFLSEAPLLDGLDAIMSVKKTDEEIKLIEKVLYFHCPNGAARSKISNNLVEKKLAVRATTRNWRTTNKLLDLIL